MNSPIELNGIIHGSKVKYVHKHSQIWGLAQGKRKKEEKKRGRQTFPVLQRSFSPTDLLRPQLPTPVVFLSVDSHGQVFLASRWEEHPHVRGTAAPTPAPTQPP